MNYDPTTDEALEKYCRNKGYPRPEVWLHGDGSFIWWHKENSKKMSLRAAQNWIRWSAPSGRFHSTREWDAWCAAERILQAKEAVITMQGFRDAIPPPLTDSERQTGMAQISEILAGMR